ncbi:MAG: HAD hydrolase-like protein [Crocinitomicaceae bacterium]|nr:HAD family hydrolase [Flavobacteriales bacterium]NQZ34415.1 HAD hydrolase-like protein [Crocinitomicaceae bacterium]
MNLIVFDIDDTLTKSEDQHQLAFVKTMKEFGISQINENWKEYAHHTDSYILKENYENNFPKPFEFNFIEDFESRMTELILELSPVTEIKGAKTMIDYLANETDYAISFATGSLLKPAFVKLNQAGINYEEQLLVGSNGIFEREGIVQESIEQAKAFYKVDSFNEIISIGDGIWDLKTARNLGIHFIGIGLKNYADFENEKIKLHIENWTEFRLSEAEEALGIK